MWVKRDSFRYQNSEAEKREKSRLILLPKSVVRRSAGKLVMVR